MLGHSMFGPKALAYAFGTREGFGEYKKQRENGVSQDLAFKRAVVKGMLAPGVEKLEDWGINKFTKNLLPELNFNAEASVKSEKPLFEAKVWNDKRNNLDVIEKLHNENESDIIKIKSGFSCFPDNKQNEYAKKISPESYLLGNGKIEQYFDVAMHGSSEAVGFWSEYTNMSPQVLAKLILHNKNYKPGQRIRLLSCNTGEIVKNRYCFAEELANAMGVEVLAPNKKIYMYPDGKVYIGKNNDGEMILYKPNDRRRLK